MPDIEITQQARYWSLHTEKLIDAAASELWHSDEPVATQVYRDWSTDGKADIRLVVVGAGQIFATAARGTTLLRTAAGWEVLTDDEARARRIPVPATDAP